MVRRSVAIVALVAAGIVAGCGGIVSPDLFVVYRTGSAPGARLTLLVTEEGVVRCNAIRVHPEKRLSDPQIIEARTIQEELQTPSSNHESLSARPGSVLSYYVRDAEGSVRFSDNSAGQQTVLHKLALFVLTVGQQVCGLSQQGA